eukprot:scaffold9003_cov69-Skeletonema_menzelii.AAC.1
MDTDVAQQHDEEPEADVETKDVEDDVAVSTTDSSAEVAAKEEEEEEVDDKKSPDESDKAEATAAVE